MAKTEQKMVKIRLFKDNGNYKDDVYVGYNGRGYMVKRGVEVEVPEAVANILAYSQEQDAHTMQVMDAAAADYERAVRDNAL